jgi:predicted  nucleic acid-binding Zn-ribbon protein
MGKSMEDRKKKGSILAKWNKIKGNHKAIKSGDIFKPDIEPLLQEYDDLFPEYDKANADKKVLEDMIRDLKKALKENGVQSRGAMENLQKLEVQGGPVYDDFAKLDSKDPKDVIDGLAAFPKDLQDVINKRKALFDQMNEASLRSVTQAKNVGTAYKSRAEEIAKTIKGLEDQAEKLEDQIQKRLAAFASKAEDIEHDDIAKEVDALGKSL